MRKVFGFRSRQNGSCSVGKYKMRERGRGRCKVRADIFAKCQKAREEEQPERILHLLRRKEFLVLRRIDLHHSGMKYKLREFLEFEDGRITAAGSKRTSRVKPRFFYV